MTDPLSAAEHEQVVRFRDDTTGLLGYVAIHSTALGPALGGTRFRPYRTEADGLADALRLARAMSYKNALAGLAHGGGKAVIVGDPATDKTPDLLRSYGRFLEALGGRYVTACDAGTSVADMDVIDETCRWVTGRSPARGGCGDSSLLTAYGLFEGMRAAAEVRWGTAVAGRPPGRASVGWARWARTWSSTWWPTAPRWWSPTSTRRPYGGCWTLIPGWSRFRTATPWSPSRWTSWRPARWAPSWTTPSPDALSAGIVCGAANNQLAHPGVAATLADRGILYVPDFLVNSGGVIQVADELRGFDLERATAAAAGIGTTTREVLTRRRTGRCAPGHRRRADRRGADGRRPLGGPVVPRSGGRSGARTGLTACTLDRRRPTPCRSVVRSRSNRVARTQTRRPGRCPARGGRAMGRGRAKAKQTKVARELKYSSHGTDLDALRAELAGERSEVRPDQIGADDRRRGRPVRGRTTRTRTTTTTSAARPRGGL